MLKLPIPDKEHIRDFDAEGWEKAYQEHQKRIENCKIPGKGKKSEDSKKP